MYNSRVNYQIKQARIWAQKLAKIPSIRAIFLSGSLAQGRFHTQADIDFFIISEPNMIWTTRFHTFQKLKKAKKLAKPNNHAGQICPNHFISSSHLELPQKNAYTAHLFAHNIPLYDPKNTYKTFKTKNQWIKKYNEDFRDHEDISIKSVHKADFKVNLYHQWKELFLKRIQIIKIKHNPDFQTPNAEIILTDTEIRFHPHPKHLNWRHS